MSEQLPAAYNELIKETNGAKIGVVDATLCSGVSHKRKEEIYHKLKKLHDECQFDDELSLSDNYKKKKDIDAQESIRLSETDALIQEQMKRWDDVQKKHQHTNDVLKVSAPFSTEFIQRIHDANEDLLYQQNFDELEWCTESEVERLYSKLDVRLYLSKYCAVQVYYTVKKMISLPQRYFKWRIASTLILQIRHVALS